MLLLEGGEGDQKRQMRGEVLRLCGGDSLYGSEEVSCWRVQPISTSHIYLRIDLEMSFRNYRTWHGLLETFFFYLQLTTLKESFNILGDRLICFFFFFN